MSIEKEYSCLENNALIYHRMVDCDADYQETLQQYSDDILRIVKCESNTYVLSIDIDSNGIQLQCKTEICVTYYNDNNELCYVDFDEEINKKINIDNLSDLAFAQVNVINKYTNYRVVNQRKMDIHISLDLDCYVYDKNTCPCISSCDESKLKIDEYKLSNIYCTNKSRIEFDEEFSIPSGSNTIKRIISNSSKAVVTECKVIKDKALVKLDVDVCILYSCNNENNEKVIHSFSLSKIIDAGGIDENDTVIVNASIGNIYCKAKNTLSDELNTIEVYGNVSISSTFIKHKDISVITDGYVVGRSSKCNYSQYNCIINSKYISEKQSNEITLKFNNDFDEIYDLDIKVLNVSCVGAKINVSLLAKAMTRADNSICCISSEASLELDLYGYSELIGSVFIDSFDYNIVSNNKVDVRLNTKSNLFLYNLDKINVLCEIDAADEYIDFPALSIYFGKKNESVWSIAKQFSSDSNLIMKENDLNYDVLDSNKILLIPSV